MTISREALVEFAWDLSDLIDSAGPEDADHPALLWARTAETQVRKIISGMAKESPTRPATPNEQTPLPVTGIGSPRVPTF
jgi:hypothetical protein